MIILLYYSNTILYLSGWNLCAYNNGQCDHFCFPGKGRKSQKSSPLGEDDVVDEDEDDYHDDSEGDDDVGKIVPGSLAEKGLVSCQCATHWTLVHGRACLGMLRMGCGCCS